MNNTTKTTNKISQNVKSNDGWVANIKFKELSGIEDSKFILEMAEKKMEKFLESADILVSRSTTLLTVIAGFLVALVGYSISSFNEEDPLNILNIISIIGIIYFIAITIYLSPNISGIGFSTPGLLPKKFLVVEFFDDKNKPDMRLKQFIWAQIENYQDSIDKNISKLNNSWNRYRKSLKLLIFSPFLAMLIFLILRFYYCIQ